MKITCILVLLFVYFCVLQDDIDICPVNLKNLVALDDSKLTEELLDQALVYVLLHSRKFAVLSGGKSSYFTCIVLPLVTT